MSQTQPVNWVHEYQKMRDDRDRWRGAAEALKQWLDKGFCWHCGVPPEQCVYTVEAVDKYHRAVDYE